MRLRVELRLLNPLVGDYFILYAMVMGSIPNIFKILVAARNFYPFFCRCHRNFGKPSFISLLYNPRIPYTKFQRSTPLSFGCALSESHSVMVEFYINTNLYNYLYRLLFIITPIKQFATLKLVIWFYIFCSHLLDKWNIQHQK